MESRSISAKSQHKSDRQTRILPCKQSMQQVYLKTRSQWRRWLTENHDRNTGIWLVFFKKETGVLTLEYDDVVEEALCFGWVDSIIKKLDKDRFVRKLTPRNDDSKWSAANIRRAELLIRQGLMTQAGMKKIEAAREAGLYKPFKPRHLTIGMPVELKKALAKNNKARNYFQQLAPSYQRHYIGWVALAKRPETTLKRIKESIKLLARGKKLGLK
ncbi:MAG: hypothetical protein HW386_2028 [Gammaproteobacteria bacterium]|nr:hypothetical protein [Gammaproteobacteria bacterium]